MSSSYTDVGSDDDVIINKPRYDADELAIAVAAHAARIAEAAGKSTSPNARYHRRLDDAADIIAHRINAPFSRESLRQSAVPRLLIWGRTLLFADDDLHRFADEILDAAPVHHGPRRGMSAGKPSTSGRSRETVNA